MVEQKTTSKTTEEIQEEFEKSYIRIRGITLAEARRYAANDTDYRHEIEADEQFFKAGFQCGSLTVGK